MEVKRAVSKRSPRDLAILQEAEEYGIDLTILEENLRLTPTERLEKLRARLAFSDEIADARKKEIRIG